MTELKSASQAIVCHLCEGQHHQLSNLSQWKDEAAQMYIKNHGLPEDGVIFNACRKDVSFQIHTQENNCVPLKQLQKMVTGTPTKIANMKYTMSWVYL